MRLERLAAKLARAQISHPWRFLLATALLTVAAGVASSTLRFDSSYEALLPKEAPQVLNADDVRERTGGTRQLVVAIGGATPEDRLEFGRTLREEILKLDDIRCADLEYPVDFFRDRGLWLADIPTLDRLIPALENAVKIAKIQANPLALHLDEEGEKKELDAAWKQVDDIVSEKKADIPFESVLESKDGKYLFLVVIPSIKFTDMKLGARVLHSIEQRVKDLDPSSRGLQVAYAGNLKVIQEQHETMSADLRNASIMALVLGIVIVAGFTRRFAAPLLIGSALVSGVAWTFALARIFVGHVNIITGFLAAVLVGLGIDFGIHLFVRFRQELNREGADVEKATVAFVQGTASPALTSALTTAGVFFSFIVADFRGFSEFGLIAGAGVIMTLLSSFLVLPPLLFVFYRKRAPARKSTQGAETSAPSSANGLRRPFAIAAVVVLAGAAIYGGVNSTDIPFRNNFKQLRGTSEATEFFEYVDENLGAGFNPCVFITSTIDDAGRVKDAAIEAEAKEASRMGRVVSVYDFLPRNIEAHRERIASLEKILWDPKLDKAAEKGGHRSDRLNEARRMVHTTAWGVEDLPEEVKRRFTTLDGKGYITYLWPGERNDADYQAAAWDDELTALSSSLRSAGVEHEMADETLIIAWIYRLIQADGPPLLILAAVVVVIFLLLDFRSPKKVALVIFPLGVGMMIFVGALHVLGMELNMFNMVVIPSVIGIGIDNAVHIYHRYVAEGRGSVVLVLKTTGVAALLASLTTAVGFGSSMISHNVGLATLGSTAVVGIASTFLAAVVFFPSVLQLLEDLTRKKGEKAAD